MTASSEDELEKELLAEISSSMVSTRALTTWDSSYNSHISRYIKWCTERKPPRQPVPATVCTVALYLQFISRSADSYSVVRSASGAIFTLHECALVPKMDIPTQS